MEEIDNVKIVFGGFKTLNNHFHEDLHQLLVLIYTHRVSGHQQYQRERAGIETYPVSVCFLSCTFSPFVPQWQNIGGVFNHLYCPLYNPC